METASTPEAVSEAHLTAEIRRQPKYKLPLTGYEFIVLRKLLEDHVAGRPIHPFDKNCAARIMGYAPECPDCGVQHMNRCPDVTPA